MVGDEPNTNASPGPREWGGPPPTPADHERGDAALRDCHAAVVRGSGRALALLDRPGADRAAARHVGARVDDNVFRELDRLLALFLHEASRSRGFAGEAPRAVVAALRRLDLPLSGRADVRLAFIEVGRLRLQAGRGRDGGAAHRPRDAAAVCGLYRDTADEVMRLVLTARRGAPAPLPPPGVRSTRIEVDRH